METEEAGAATAGTVLTFKGGIQPYYVEGQKWFARGMVGGADLPGIARGWPRLSLLQTAGPPPGRRGVGRRAA